VTFIAEFDDGPMTSASHTFLGVDLPFADLYAMPHPADADAPWIIVGYSGMEPDEPWSGQVHYRLFTTELEAEPVGRYVLADAR
jgi:hypothetical protein